MRMMLLTVVLAIAAADSFAQVPIPLSADSGWRDLTFRKIPPNKVRHDNDTMVIDVAGSASPLVYRLDEPLQVTGVVVRARWSGELPIPAGATQGDEGADDFVLKLGLVESGDKTLNWVQRGLAAEWIKRLYALAPKGSGVRRIHFLSTTQQAALVGSSRTHPLSDLLYETRVRQLESPGEFTLHWEADAPVDVLGLWISADGDDTGSSFELTIYSIELDVVERNAEITSVADSPGGAA